jgi:hypothetical protein
MVMCGVMFINTHSRRTCATASTAADVAAELAAAAWGWLNMSDCGRAPGARLLVLVWATCGASAGGGIRLSQAMERWQVRKVGMEQKLLRCADSSDNAVEQKGFGRALPPPTVISSAVQHARAFRAMRPCCYGHRARVRMWKCTSAVERVRVEIWVSKHGVWYGGME